MRTALLLLLAACGSASAPSPAPNDWSAKPVEVATTDAVNHVPFTITLPKGMTALGEHDNAPPTPADQSRVFAVTGPGSESLPTVTVSFLGSAARDLEALRAVAGVQHKGPDGTPLVTLANEAREPDGFLVSVRGPKDVVVETYVEHRRDGLALRCRGAQSGTIGAGVPHPAETLALLEKICRSLAIGKA